MSKWVLLRSKKLVLYVLAFFVKGWEVNILLLLPYFKTQNLINVFELGILASIFSVFQLLSALVAGFLSERFSNKLVMFLAIVFYALVWFLLSLPKEFILLSIVCALAGSGNGFFIPLANSAIAKISTKNRAREMGDFSAVTDMGRVALTPIITFVIGTFGFIYLSVGFTITSILLVIFLLFSLKSFSAGKKETPQEEKVNTSAIKLLKNKNFLMSIFIGQFDGFASISLFIFIPLLLIPKGIDISSIGLLSAIFFLGYMLGRVTLGRLADKYSATKILAIAEVLMAMLILVLIFVNNFVFIAIVVFALGIFTRGTSPITRALVAHSVEDERKFDKAYSLYSFSVQCANVSSRSIYGFIAGTLGIASVFYLSAAFALLTLLPISKYSNKQKS